MSRILAVWGATMPEAQAVARVIERVIEAERVDGFAIPGICADDVLARWGVSRLPVVMTDGRILCQGNSMPSEEVVKTWIANHGRG